MPQDSSKNLYLLFSMLCIFTLVFTGIAIYRYELFLHDGSGDLLIFEQVLHNTTHGRFFYNNFSHQSHFGDHNSPMLGLLALVSLLFPVTHVLYICTVLSIAFSAIPIYLLAEEYFGPRPALLLSATYLMLPTFVGQPFFSFHEINLVLPFLTFSFYFFTKEKFLPFAASFMLALLVKEDTALTLFMFAPYALIKRKGWRWSVFPAVVSVVWFLVSVKLLIPYFNKGATYGVGVGYFSNIGSSLSEIVVNTLGKPLHTLGIMLQEEKLKYLFILLLPVGLFLPLLSAEAIFAVPSLFFNLLATSGRFRYNMIQSEGEFFYFPRHMSLMAAVFLFIAAMYSIKKLAVLAPKAAPKLVPLAALVLLCITLYDDRFLLCKYNYLEQAGLVAGAPTTVALRSVLAKIPLDATVKANIGIANHLYDRKEAYYPLAGPVESDYAVVTGQEAAEWTAGGMTQKYDMVAQETNVSLYKKRSRP